MSDSPEYDIAESSGLQGGATIVVFDMTRSLAFWRDLLGFSVVHRSDMTVQLARRPGGIMLHQPGPRGQGRQVDPPLGCGVTLRFALDNYEQVKTVLLRARWPVYGGPQAAWRRAWDADALPRDAFVQDPDGYLLQLTPARGGWSSWEVPKTGHAIGESSSAQALLHALIHQDSFGGIIVRRRQGGVWHYDNIVGAATFGLEQGGADLDGSEEVVQREQALASVSIEQFHLLRHLTASRERACREQR